jgi:tellurium resistance protein TerD
MAISLSKGGNISLSKTDPQLKNMLVGLSWDARSTDGLDFDLDASVFMVKDDNKVRGDHDFIFYNQLKSTSMMPMPGARISGRCIMPRSDWSTRIPIMR